MGADLRNFGIMASSDGAAYNVTGLFANILYDATNVMLRRAYAETATTFQRWMRQGESLNDFKPVHKVIGGELSDPKAIPEDGEFEETTHSDARESYKLTVWGEIFSCSWQLIVNDQLGEFTKIPVKQGAAMRRKQNKLAYGVLQDNAAMADTGLLFNATAITTAGGHNNLATGAGPPSVSTLDALSKKMAEMCGLNTTDKTILNLEPKYIIFPPALRGTVLKLLGSFADPAVGGSAAGNSNVKNIWQDGLKPVQEGQLGLFAGGSDVAWYLAADSAAVDTIEYAYLAGLESPAFEQETAFDRLAIRMRIYQAFAVHPLDYRGLQKHAGA